MNKYEDEYHKEKHGHLYNDEEYYNLRARVSEHDLIEIQPYLHYFTHMNILDYGGGFGQNTYYFNNSLVYDKSKFAVDFCKKKGINATNNLKSIKNNSFQTILCSEVLEHLENPLKELKNIRSKLHKDGRLILILPIDKWNKPNIYDVNQHLFNWNFNTITNLLVRAGFFPLRYEILRRTGFKKLLPFSRISFSLYLSLTKLAAVFSGSKHMVIVAEKDRW